MVAADKLISIFGNMSIIPHVTWDEFTTITGAQEFDNFTEKGERIVLFITDWSYPSRLTLKRIKKLHFDYKKCGIIDVDLVDSNELVDRFEVHQNQARLSQCHTVW